MNLGSLLLILVSVTISALAQVSLKIGMSSAAVQHAMAASTTDMIYAAAQNPSVLGGLLLYAVGAVAWIIVLSRVDVSQAYPFMGLGIVLTFSIGHYVLREPVTSLRLFGMALVIAGIGMVAQS